MITKLEQLTAGQFIDLVCGDTDILRNGNDRIPESEVLTAMRNIVFEYKEIADPSGARIYLSSIDELVKARISVAMLSICENLIGLGEYDRAKEILEAAGINAGTMSERRLAAEIKSRLGRAKKTIAQNDEDAASDKKDTPEMHRIFDEQTAAMMVYFKFQIDTSTMQASIYAHLVARYNREIRAHVAALKKKAK